MHACPFRLHPASYGSLARFKDVQRLQAVGDYTVVGAGGDMSDFQYIQRMLDDVAVEEIAAQDGHELGPVEIHELLSQVMYGRRSQIDPLWNSLIIGGFKDGRRYVVTSCLLGDAEVWVEHRFLSYVDLLGTTYTASTIATGYGASIAQPLLRKAVEGYEDTLTEEQAQKILENSMRVLFYRDARSLNKACLPVDHSGFNADVVIICLVSTSNHHSRWSTDLRFIASGYVLELCRGHQRVWSSDSVANTPCFVVSLILSSLASLCSELRTNLIIPGESVYTTGLLLSNISIMIGQ